MARSRLIWAAILAVVAYAIGLLFVRSFTQSRTKDTLATKTSNPIEWLHIPKTGTSFGNTLLRWACPELNRTKLWVTEHYVHDVPDDCKAKLYLHPGNRKRWYVGDHITLQNRSDAQLEHVFTFIRSPKKRTASGYHFVKNVLQRPPQATNNATEKEICEYARKINWAYAALGAQVKIIIGEPFLGQYSFKNPEPPTQPDIDRACARLRSFAFVGITEFWATSICLFHSRFGGHPDAIEKVNVRSGTYRTGGGRARVDCNDKADEALFKCALERFFAELSSYPDCLSHLDAD